MMGGAVQESRDQQQLLLQNLTFPLPHSQEAQVTQVNTIMEEKEIDAHNVTVEELCKRFNTSIEAGLTDKQVAEALEEHDDDDRYHRHRHYRN